MSREYRALVAHGGLEEKSLGRTARRAGRMASQFIDRRQTEGALKRAFGKGAKVKVSRTGATRTHGRFNVEANGVVMGGHVRKRALRVQTIFGTGAKASRSGSGARAMHGALRAAGRRGKLLEGSTNGMSGSAIRAGRYLAKRGASVHIARDARTAAGRSTRTDQSHRSQSGLPVFIAQPKGVRGPSRRQFRKLTFKR